MEIKVIVNKQKKKHYINRMIMFLNEKYKNQKGYEMKSHKKKS